MRRGEERRRKVVRCGCVCGCGYKRGRLLRELVVWEWKVVGNGGMARWAEGVG